ncbi:hypothetical protein SAMN04488689_11941 [Paenibacillus sp. cl6col]|nr:hypothetical protein SAMN04488689_11941 [Paenibacillus sp. cl6col]
MAAGLFQDLAENLLENVGILEATHIVFAKGTEMRNGPGKVIAEKPAVSHISFDFSNGLAHGTMPNRY